ncbi:hypothetical protein Esti_000841 [Eimeria stiedai]
MAARRQGAARQQTEWLGAAEERKLFAADTMAACMHWPPGYSLNSANWSTEAFDSFQRPVTPRPERRAPVASEAAAQQVPFNTLPFKSEPEEEVGLFSAEVLPSRLQNWKSPKGAPVERGLPEGTPHLHYPQAFQPSHQLPQHQSLFPHARLQEQRQQPQQPLLYPAAAAAAAAGQKQQYTFTSPLRGSGVELLAGAEALGGKRSPPKHNSSPERRDPQGFPSLSSSLSFAPTEGAQRRPSSSLRGRRGSRQGRLGSRTMQGSLSEAFGADRQIQPKTVDVIKTPDAAAEGLTAAAPQSLQQLLQQQRDVLQQQFEGVERLRVQLEGLEGALRLLQLQGSGPQQQPCSLAAAAEQQRGVSAVSACLDAREDDAESQCWSLDPRDYKHLPAELLDWIPPAGLPSVRRRPSQ